MSSRSSWSYLWLLAALDAMWLRFAWPHPTALGHDLSDPHRWVSTAGADGAAATLAGVALWCVAAWFALGLLTVALIRLPGAVGRFAGRAARVLLPAALYRLVAGAAGLGVVLTPIAATADPAPLPAPTIPVATVPAASAPLAVPRLPGMPPAATSAPGRPTPGALAVAGPTAIHVVAAGDSLWRIAATELGSGSTAARVAAAWPHIYAANRTVIGADPDLIRPGQVLRLPDTGTAASPAAGTDTATAGAAR